MALGQPWEDPRAAIPCPGAGHLWAAPMPGVGPSSPPLIPLPLSLSLSLTRKTPSSSSKHEFLLLLLPNFDLVAQPLISAEIGSICFPICDSSVHPSRILFSGVFLEYFAAVGDMLSELACLIYA